MLRPSFYSNQFHPSPSLFYFHVQISLLAHTTSCHLYPRSLHDLIIPDLLAQPTPRDEVSTPLGVDPTATPPLYNIRRLFPPIVYTCTTL